MTRRSSRSCARSSPNNWATLVRLLDKQPGETSHDVVARVRRGLPRKSKVGHAGTLDPFATGLLLVLIGPATRAQRWFMGLRKTYEVTARFGWTSTTGDPEGELVETGRMPALELPTGTFMQRPPAYSAIKIGGERAYKKARRGEDVEMPEREVTVYRFEHTPPDRFVIECSSGTYVRSLIADLGDAYCTSLRRTAIGPFRVEDAGTELSLQEALGRVMPVLELDEPQAANAVHGRAVQAEAQGDVLLVDEAGPIAIAGPRDEAGLRILVGFRGS
jgi:tRNA pseudouridine55 synthase